MIRHEKSNLLSKISVHNDVVYFSGLTNTNGHDIKIQTEQLTEDINKHLENIGSCKSNIIHILIHLKDMTDYAAMNQVYLSWIAPLSPPSRTCVAAILPNPAALVEFTVIAALARNDHSTLQD